MLLGIATHLPQCLANAAGTHSLKSLQIVGRSPRSQEKLPVPRRLPRFRAVNQSMLVNLKFLKGQSYRRSVS